ncbi:hypothetical protein [Flavobacterium caeni]|uniref:Uncharacterized protein n=1 Tax=Flavobacterium caeni TaxID=490189 RepID=A0A1G5IAX4_9FLAO|nr:hypothetical protein [Flavobacterium caeni]SCY73154.1 hypothetical protein SAMN02927903_02204 [Flavobacterium caeni]
MPSKLKVESQKSKGAAQLGKIFLVLVVLLYSGVTHAQCAMCRAAIESEGDVAKAEAVNDGIVYLMIIPYLIVGAVAYGVYKLRQKKAI